MEDLTDAQLSIINKVEKLLRLASNNPNEAEAASAAEKAQELLAAYNLDMVSVERHAPQASGGRQDRRLAGGLYKWQRELWEHVAKLNFCLYFTQKGTIKGARYEHRVVGRTVNIVSTRVMAEYLETTIERLAREFAAEEMVNIFAKPAVAFREGCAARIGERLQQRRREQKREAEKAAAEKAAARANHTSHSCATPEEQALTIVDVERSEYDDNQELLHPGWKADLERGRLARLAREERQRLALAAAEQWALEHPEEAAAQAKKDQEANAKWHREYERRERRNKKRRKGTGGGYRAWEPRHESYYVGYDRGDKVSLDQQVEAKSKKRITN